MTVCHFAARIPGMSTFTTNRVQAGIPEGGQFAQSARSRPDVSDLIVDTDDDGDAGQPLTSDHLSHVEKPVNYLWNRYGASSSNPDYTREEMMQNSYVKVMESIADGKRAKNPKAYVTKLVKNCFAEAFRNGSDYRTIKTRSEIDARSAAMSQNLGRSLRPSEVDRITEEVRASKDKHDRPSKDRLARSKMTVSATDDITLVAELNSANVDSAEEAYFTSEAPEVAGSEALLSEAEERGMHNAYGLRRKASTAILAHHGAPAVVPNSVKSHRRNAARKVLESQGIHEAMQDHNNGYSTDGTQALFTPWSGRNTLSVDQKDAIVDALSTGDGEYAWDLWTGSAAVSDTATNNKDEGVKAKPKASTHDAQAQDSQPSFAWF